LEALFYALSGFFMKISDDAHDKKNNTIFGIAAAILCGFCIGYLAVQSADAACIFLAILIGTLAAFKVDCVNHVLSLMVFLAVILLLGFPAIGVISLAICAAAAFIDEIGNDNQRIARMKPIELFFEYRCALKIGVLILVVLGLLQTTFPVLKIPGVQFFQFQTFIYFLLFEISYELVGLKFDTIYNGLYSFLRILRGVNGPADD
jgi:hypothetical protein